MNIKDLVHQHKQACRDYQASLKSDRGYDKRDTYILEARCRRLQEAILEAQAHEQAK